jgi:hypothetical protein
VKHLCLTVLLLSGCAREFKANARPPTGLLPADYPEVLKAWTREGHAFSGLEHKVTVKATLMAPMLRKAFEVRFPEVYGYGGVVTRQELREVSEETESTLNFFVAVYTNNFRWNDLQRPDSIWHVTLETSDSLQGKPTSSMDAVKIERIKVDENLYTVFPYLNAFETAYIMRFPKFSPASQPLLASTQRTYLRMRIASSFAERELTWTIEP